ncbi:electroneutral sodium bicarbonate exchanger 1-like [Pogoniulus pusillus]|uniref:electroneutral sodium bicarbonate exchanger 1-like n=1 Tax=Pogoniulus pusillus TaxID=488313 RepID=UPI0030B994BD
MMLHVRRWLKFEEDVEDGGERWSKPYVGTLPLPSLLELKSFITSGTVLLDISASSMEEIADAILQQQGQLTGPEEQARARVREVLLMQHQHQKKKERSCWLPKAVAPGAQEDARSCRWQRFAKPAGETHWLCGGLIRDVKCRALWYWSDFRDALSLQCLASFLFLYCACMSPVITFGGLLGEATEGHIGAMESLLGACLSGVLYCLFAGQPLTILGSTGPVLVFEKIIYQFCK